MTLPNFLVIGAQKSGTSALYNALANHPQIYMPPVKEPWFFALQGKSSPFSGPAGALYNHMFCHDLAEYQALFADAGAARYRGEASTAYLMADYAEATASNLQHQIPDVKLIAILRQPAERAYSAYCHLRAPNMEPAQDFAHALAAENTATRATWTPDFRYRRNGEYAKLLAPYLARFDRDQIRVYLHDEFLARPEATLRDLFGWLGVEPVVQPVMLQWMKVEHPLFKLTRRAQSPNFPPLSAEMWQTLTEEYRPDILHLQEILNRDLGHWLVPSMPKGS